MILSARSSLESDWGLVEESPLELGTELGVDSEIENGAEELKQE